MTTYIDILDTAVKIGLGALISGVATYFVTRSKHKHEIRKEISGYNRVLLERICLAIKESENAMMRIVQLITGLHGSREGEYDNIVSQAKDEFIKVFEGLSTAEGLAYMLGNADLNQILKSYSEEAMKYFYVLNGQEMDAKRMDEITYNINQLKENIPEIMAKTYNSILP
jgi:hypothetical protein